MLARLVASARQKVVEGMSSLAKCTPEAASQLANDLHTIAGEAAMLDRADLARAAAEGEDTARALAGGRMEALVPCMRALRRLGYLLQVRGQAPRNARRLLQLLRTSGILTP
jgi:HPt (histidine-containing phosphotransfer) domain-containing protein